LKDRYGLAGPETKLGIKTERAIVVTGLEQAHADRFLLGRAIKDVPHQAPAHVVCKSSLEPHARGSPAAAARIALRGFLKWALAAVAVTLMGLWCT
jgi:hypothetical protein